MSNRTDQENENSRLFYQRLVDYFGEDVVKRGKFIEGELKTKDAWINPEKTLKIPHDISPPPFYVEGIDELGYFISCHVAPTFSGAMELANKSLLSRAYHSQTEEN
jgi:hypothetical protein